MAVILFQRVDWTMTAFGEPMYAAQETVALVDYLSSPYMSGLESYAHELNRRPYVYAMHWMPFDIMHPEQVSGRTRYEAAQRLLAGPVRALPKLNPAEGIQLVRFLLRTCQIDRERCAGLLAALRDYRYAWTPGTQSYGKPEHGQSSHAADCLRYLAQAAKMSAPGRSERVKGLRRAKLDFDPFTWDAQRRAEEGWR
jgi:hypothetical protein